MNYDFAKSVRIGDMVAELVALNGGKLAKNRLMDTVYLLHKCGMKIEFDDWEYKRPPR